METKAFQKEIAAAKKAIEKLPSNHELAPESWKEELREQAREMSCGGMFRTSPRKAGQSYNAMYAEQRGELTKSKLPAVLKRMHAAGFAKTSMWHHTGCFKGYMNETEFFAGCDFDLAAYENYLLNKDSIDRKRLQVTSKNSVKSLRKNHEAALLENKKNEWLKSNCTFVTRVTDRLFVETAREMNGKYGWFDSAYKSYNLPEYFSGWKLNPGANQDEYYSLFNQAAVS